jgi:hypothetical protein
MYGTKKEIANGKIIKIWGSNVEKINKRPFEKLKKNRVLPTCLSPLQFM